MSLRMTGRRCGPCARFPTAVRGHIGLERLGETRMANQCGACKACRQGLRPASDGTSISSPPLTGLSVMGARPVPEGCHWLLAAPANPRTIWASRSQHCGKGPGRVTAGGSMALEQRISRGVLRAVAPCRLNSARRGGSFHASSSANRTWGLLREAAPWVRAFQREQGVGGLGSVHGGWRQSRAVLEGSARHAQRAWGKSLGRGRGKGFPWRTMVLEAQASNARPSGPHSGNPQHRSWGRAGGR